MSKTLFTLLAFLALATAFAVAQEPPAQSQPGQAQPMPQSQQPSQPQQQPPAAEPQQQPPAAEPQQQAPAGQGQTGMSSDKLQAAFDSTFQKYPELSNVKAKVSDDKTELSGTVPTQADKDKVRRTAEANADGRKIVDDDLKVSGGENKPSNPPPSAPPQ